MPLDIKKIRTASELVYEASRSIRILTHVSWPAIVRDRFLRSKANALPVVEYPKYDVQPVFEKLKTARNSFDCGVEVNQWFSGIADRLETSAKMLAATSSPDFFQYSKQLYGAPTSELIDEKNTPLDLANQFDSLFDKFQNMDLGVANGNTATAEQVCETMTQAAAAMFGTSAPDVYLVDELSANALAGPKRIRIRSNAQFTDKDVQQLVHHEAHIHVATSLNGIAQPNLKILAAAHPGTTKSQEGLAVFAEFISGAMDLDRFRRLADRVIAIQMAVDGADFIQVYQYFLERTGNEIQSFENARRVFRGGVITGGAPFTKDVVYLDGLLRVHNFLRTMVASGRPDCIRWLFCGKLDIEDFPIIARLAELGICKPAKFLPPWASDIRFLLCYLTYSAFLNTIDLEQVKTHYQQMLHQLPRLPIDTNPREI